MDSSTAAQLNGSWPHYGRWCGSLNGTLWNIGRIAGSLRLNAGGLDHLAPFLGFFGDQPAELGRRSRQRRAAEVSETGLHLRIVESRVDLLVELVDNLGRRGLRYAEAEPDACFVAGQDLGDRGNIW